MKMINQDTICAIATAQGGAIGIIRVSGPKAIEITSRIFTPATGKPLTERAPYTLTFGKICSPKRKINNTLFQQTSEIPQEKSETLQKTSSITSSAEEVIDEVLISLFRAPHSYTGEDSTEIMCHGSSYILQQVIQLLIYNGCRAALPGEYTQRAFLNGKMDLSQAEAVADLIASSSASTHRLAMSQMRGGFSKELSNLRNQLLHFTSLMELELDFSDHEELEFANRDELSSLATHIEQVIARLAHSFSVGNAIKNGIPVAIIGETNAGKSTLLNALLNEEKAIVSDIHGTTRDVIEDTINLQGVTFRFIDTAGIRQTNDTIENLGIERTFQKMDQAYVILWMIDSTDAQRRFEELKADILPHCEGKKMIILFNKSDLLLATQKEELSAIFADMKVEKLFISAKENHIDIEGAKIIEPEKSGKFDEYVNTLYELRQKKGMTIEKAKVLVKDPVYFGMLMLKDQNTEADGLVSGAVHSTADTLRPALQILKTAEETKLVSAFFVMVVPNCEYGENGTFVFGDCGLNQNPTDEELSEIAISSAKSFKLKYAEAPSPNIKANARHTIVRGNTTFVAPFPKYPTPQPINIWSTIL